MKVGQNTPLKQSQVQPQNSKLVAPWLPVIGAMCLQGCALKKIEGSPVL